MERVQQLDGGDGCAAMRVCVRSPNVHLEVVKMVYFMCILTQQKSERMANGNESYEINPSNIKAYKMANEMPGFSVLLPPAIHSGSDLLEENPSRLFSVCLQACTHTQPTLIFVRLHSSTFSFINFLLGYICCAGRIHCDISK
jgi:hypothetical protein